MSGMKNGRRSLWPEVPYSDPAAIELNNFAWSCRRTAASSSAAIRNTSPGCLSRRG
jgi:hypothetical protein